MISLLQNYKGNIDIDGQLEAGKPFHIVLTSKTKPQAVEEVKEQTEYRIVVKQYMTRKATPEFNFMTQWNNDNPMPLRTMTGYIEKETRGMVYMHLHGEGLETVTCMCCGKELKNPISRHYGIGPVCMAKVGITCDIDNIEEIKERLVNVKWSGWIIKSAILEKEVIDNADSN
jgi:hypothetical protein